MTILETIKNINIDFTKGLIDYSDAEHLSHEFEISAKEFLNFSKLDLKSNDTRGNVNALTNAKRAIDCQTDMIFLISGLNLKTFPPSVEKFISLSKHSSVRKDLPIKWRLLQALQFAPAQIVSNARLLRNKLEHQYSLPTKEEVHNAIELADLFILATGNKLKSFWTFSITDSEKFKKNDRRHWDGINVVFNSKNHCFELTGFIGANNRQEIFVHNTEIDFYYLLKYLLLTIIRKTLKVL